MSKVIIPLAALLAIGAAAVISSLPAGAATDDVHVMAEAATEAIAETKAPVAARVDEVEAALQSARSIEIDATSQSLDTALETISAAAEVMESFAEDGSGIREIIVGGRSEIVAIGEGITNGEKAALDEAAEMASLAGESKDADEKVAYQAAEGIARERAQLWKAFAKTNAGLANGLAQIDKDVERLARIAKANAAVFDQAQKTATLSRDLVSASELLRDKAGADISELVESMKSTWNRLEGLSAEMTATAAKLAAAPTD